MFTVPTGTIINRLFKNNRVHSEPGFPGLLSVSYYRLLVRMQ